MAQLSAWQDYVANKLYLQQISIPLTVRTNIRILPGKNINIYPTTEQDIFYT